MDIANDEEGSMHCTDDELHLINVALHSGLELVLKIFNVLAPGEKGRLGLPQLVRFFDASLPILRGVKHSSAHQEAKDFLAQCRAEYRWELGSMAGASLRQ